MSTGAVTWSKTAATNATADASVNWAEGQAPSSVNDSARGMMASFAKWRDDNNGTLTTGGTSTAYTITTNQVFAALTAGYTLTLTLHTANGASCTLAPDGLTAKPIRAVPGTDLLAGAYSTGTPLQISYFTSNSGEWIILNAGTAAQVPTGTEHDYAGVQLPAGFLWCDGGSVSRSTYSALFNALTSSCTGSTHTSSNITGLSVDLRNLGLVGAYVEGTGIPTGAKIASFVSSTSINLTASTSGSSAGISLRILPHGQGDAATSFNVPDRRGRSIVGRDDMNGTAAGRVTTNYDGTQLGVTGGAQTTTQVPSHTHAITDPGHTHTATTASGAANCAAGGSVQAQTGTTGSSVTGISINSTGASSVDIFTPFGISNKIIKT